MLKRTKIVSLLSADKTMPQVLLKGWVRTRRDAKDFSFIEVNDGSCLKNIQVIANNNLPNYDEVKKLTTGSSLAVSGALVESKGGSQKYEVVAENIEIYDLAPDDFRCRKRNIPMSICAALPICVPEPTNTVPLFGFVLNYHMLFINFSMNAASVMSIPR